MTEFKVGQRVHVEFDGVIQYVHQSNDGLAEVTADSHDFTNSIGLEYITLTDPANWPPQVGDIWLADGEEYAVLAMDDETGSVSIASFGLPVVAYYTDFGPAVEEFKALNPVLVRRRGQ